VRFIAVVHITPDLFIEHKSAYKYIPASNSLSVAHDIEEYYVTGNQNILSDSQNAYVLESLDDANQDLIRLSDENTVLTTPITTSACATIDEDRHGLITANSGSSTVTVYYDDSSTVTATIDSATGSTKHLYLHREKKIYDNRRKCTGRFVLYCDKWINFMPSSLYNAFNALNITRRTKITYISGILGGGNRT